MAIKLIEMKKIFLLSLFSLFFSLGTAQWSGDGWFLDIPNGKIWGYYETVDNPGSAAGVFYRMINSPQLIINAEPNGRAANGWLLLLWTQYRSYQNQWYPEWAGVMEINDAVLVPRANIPTFFQDSLSPSRQLIQGAYFGRMRTLTKYVSNTPVSYTTSWAQVAFTINGGALGTTANDPFNGLREGYVLDTKGNIEGDYIVYQEPAQGGWGSMNGQLIYYYRTGGYNVTIICPQQYELGTGRVIGFWNRYRVNSSNMNRTLNIFRPSEWILEESGIINFVRTPARCPDFSPTTTLNGLEIVGCLHANFLTQYKYTGYNTMEVRGAWVPKVFSLTRGQTAPAPVSGDPCDDWCNIYCIRDMKKNAGRYNGSTSCVLGQVYYPSKGCDCE